MILWLVGVGVLIIAVVLLFLWLKYSPSKIMRYIAGEAVNGSVCLVRNGKTILNKNADELMPLASTVKIIVAIAFARQAANNDVNPEESILLSDLEKYFIKNTDGGAHQSWLKKIKSRGLVKEETVPLLDVARGMMKFSSNANTEYLFEKLGLDKINDIINKFGLARHEKLYPFGSSLLVLRDHSMQDLERMGKTEYIRLSYEMHSRLKNKSINKSISKKDISIEKQKLFSDWFVQGTAREYVHILNGMNSEKYLSAKEREYVYQIMKQPFKSTRIIHSGEKEGETLFVLTMAVYETFKNGDKVELALFLKNLTLMQYFVYSLTAGMLKHDLLSNRNIENYTKILHQIQRKRY